MTKSNRSRFIARLAPIVLSALLAAAPAIAQEKTTEIDKIFSWATPTSPGGTVAVWQHGKLIASRAYGSADLERDVPISTSSIFDAGSLTKQFVAAAALLLVEDGRISLTDDIRKYIPELPDYGHKITVDHLLTHTSGIRDWTMMLPLAAGKDDVLTIIRRQRSLSFTPGDEWSYSNSGFVLAKEIIARASGMSFGEFTRTRLFEPLGMNSSSYRDDMRAIIKNRALAYDKQGDGWRMAMLLDDDRGGGGVLSTSEDLAIWNDALTNNRLGARVSEKLQEQTVLNNGRKIEYCRGLFVGSYRGTKEVWHSGSADGYKSWLGRYPEHGLSIAIMCNSGDGTDRVDFAHRIFDLFVPDAGPVDPEAGPPPAVTGDAASELSSKAGLFFNERTGEPIRLAVDRGRFRVAGGPGLVAITKDRFRRWGARLDFMSADAFELNFTSPDRFEMKSMEGQTTNYRRARPFAPTADELKSFTGRYESDEIGTIFGIEPKGAGLVVRLEHSPSKALDFVPVDTDTFQFSRMTVRFRRDDAGTVTGFDFSNPLLRNVRFTRLGERQ